MPLQTRSARSVGKELARGFAKHMAIVALVTFGLVLMRLAGWDLAVPLLLR